MPANEHTIATAPGSAVAAVAALAGQVEAERQGCDRKEDAECLDQLFLLHADRLQVRHEGMTCTPLAAEIMPVTTPTMPPTHFSFAGATEKLNLLRAMTALIASNRPSTTAV